MVMSVLPVFDPTSLPLMQKRGGERCGVMGRGWGGGGGGGG